MIDTRSKRFNGSSYFHHHGLATIWLNESTVLGKYRNFKCSLMLIFVYSPYLHQWLSSHYHVYVLWATCIETAVCWYKMWEITIFNISNLMLNILGHSFSYCYRHWYWYLLHNCPTFLQVVIFLVSVVVVVVVMAVHLSLIIAWFTIGSVSLQQYNRYSVLSIVSMSLTVFVSMCELPHLLPDPYRSCILRKQKIRPILRH